MTADEKTASTGGDTDGSTSVEPAKPKAPSGQAGSSIAPPTIYLTSDDIKKGPQLTKRLYCDKGDGLFRRVKSKGPEGIVRGGTTSSAYDNEMAERLSQAEQRRADDEAERHLGTIPIEQGGALNFERKLADPDVHPRVLIAYVAWGKEILHEQLCELVYDDVQDPPAHILILVCPECFRRGVPTQFAQMHVRDNHRSWSIDTRGAGQMKAVSNDAVAGGIEFYHYAGKIMDTDVLRCDGVNCGAGFKINKNRLYRVK